MGFLNSHRSVYTFIKTLDIRTAGPLNYGFFQRQGLLKKGAHSHVYPTVLITNNLIGREDENGNHLLEDNNY